MGWFGSDKSETYSTTELTQVDSSVNAAGDAETILGSGANLTQAQNSLVLGGANEGEVIFNAFPEAVQRTVADLIKSVDKAGQGQLASTQALGQKLSDLQVGEASLLPKIMLYGIVGGVVLILGRKLIK